MLSIWKVFFILVNEFNLFSLQENQNNTQKIILIICLVLIVRDNTNRI